MAELVGFDEDALIAAVDVVGRSGARDVEIGYLDEDAATAAEARWYATATYQGAKLVAEDHRSPVDAAEALARRVLEGGRCTHCDRTIRLGGEPSPQHCRWTRTGDRWQRGCP